MIKLGNVTSFRTTSHLFDQAVDYPLHRSKRLTNVPDIAVTGARAGDREMVARNGGALQNGPWPTIETRNSVHSNSPQTGAVEGVAVC
jgi:hypothetical protein